MGLLRACAAAWREFRSSLSSGDPKLVELFGGGPLSTAGIQVTEGSALGVASFFGAIRVISDGIAMLPIEVYQRLPQGGRKPALDHDLRFVLHDEANAEMSAYTFKQTLQGHVLLRGNGFGFLERTGAGRVRAIWPLRPDRVIVERINGELRYWIGAGDGYEPEKWVWAPYGKESIFHLRGLGGNGLIGYSLLRVMRESLGLAMATQQFGSRLFSGGARPGGVLEHPGGLTPVAKENIRRGWEKLHQGVENAHQIAILEEGMSFRTISVNPEDAQFLQTRKFQREEIAAFTGVPLHMLGDLEKSSYASVEQQSLDFLTYCLGPWKTCWEQELARAVFSVRDYGRYFPEFDDRPLLRGDLAARQAYYSAGRQWGWLSIDRILDLEGEPPLPGGRGQGHLIPANMIEIGGMPPTESAPASPIPPAAPEGPPPEGSPPPPPLAPQVK